MDKKETATKEDLMAASGRGPLRPPPALPVHPDLLLYLT